MWHIKFLNICRSLLWPSRPEPSKSRKIAGYRLIFSGFSMLLIFTLIGAQSIALALSKPKTSNHSYATINDKVRGAILSWALF